MSFTLENVVPWGRNFNEYVSMFSLSNEDLNKYILGCGDGPASFNSELTERGGRIISIDPIYKFDASEIKKRISETYDQVIDQTKRNANEFIWNNIKSVEELGRIRIDAMNSFLVDYQNSSDRYLSEELPILAFNDSEFDLALCSHFLFLYSEQFSAEFHIQSLKELSRVAIEVRVFPLLELGSKKSRHLDMVIGHLSESGYNCIIEKVPYEFQKGGNEMLRIKSSNKVNSTAKNSSAD